MQHILTYADTTFYPMGLRLAKNIRQLGNYSLTLYDLGLTFEEKKTLLALGVTIEQAQLTEKIDAVTDKNVIRTTHKIFCIEHFLQKYKKTVIVLDADILIIEDFSEILPTQKECIVVTRRCPREQKPHILRNGKINAGVMILSAHIPKHFFQAWAKLCQDITYTDQSALSFLLEQEVDLNLCNTPQPFMQFQAIVQEGCIYNDVTCRTGKIFHFKSAGRRASKMFTYKLFFAVQHLFPTLMQKLIRYNRKHKIFIWKP